MQRGEVNQDDEATCPRATRSVGGGKRDRTADLLHAMQALSQLSYTPIQNGFCASGMTQNRAMSANGPARRAAIIYAAHATSQALSRSPGTMLESLRLLHKSKKPTEKPAFSPYSQQKLANAIRSSITTQFPRTILDSILVPTARLELAQLSPLPPQDSVSTNFTTSAIQYGPGLVRSRPFSPRGLEGSPLYRLVAHF